ncbi:hypothetical protein ACF0H5_022676 [Mactra antiquata]
MPNSSGQMLDVKVLYKDRWMTKMIISGHVVVSVCLIAMCTYSTAKDCDAGSYGNKCNNRCGHCDGDHSCNQQTGVCNHGCLNGFQGDMCTLNCKDGFYGKNCSRACSCANEYPCNKISGVCYCNFNEDMPENGKVSVVYGKSVHYTCIGDYHLVGEPSRDCLADGTWSHSAPQCVKNTGFCNENTDNRGTLWSKTKAGTKPVKPCSNGFNGNVSRQCTWDGHWLLPVYYCVRSNIQQIHQQVSGLSKQSSAGDVSSALERMHTSISDQNITKDSTFTAGELNILSSSLGNIADILLTSDIKPTDNVSNHFIDSVNYLIDSNTHDDWKALKDSGETDAVQVLSAVDTFSEYIRNNLNNTKGKSLTVVKENIAIETKTIDKEDVVFPDNSIKLNNPHSDWIKHSSSSIVLQSSALNDSTVSYVSTAVMYRDLSDIIPIKTGDKSSNNGLSSTDGNNRTINGPIISLSITPSIQYTLDPPVKIRLVHKHQNYNLPLCSYWNFTSKNSGYWSGSGCKVVSTNQTDTVCSCNHLTNFAVLMSPFKTDVEPSLAIQLISIIGMCISILCLVITTTIHIWLWKYLKKERTYILMNLCFALIASYILFLAGVDRAENKVICTVIAALLHYIFLVVFCIMLAEGIEIAITVLYVFSTKRPIVKWLLISAWGIPAVIVGCSLGVTRLKGYGNSNYCWLSVDNGLIWAFVGPALAIITFNMICLVLVIRALFFTRIMEAKKQTEKVKTGLRSLCVLVPVTGVSWILGIFYMNDDTNFMQYVFAICNGLQGLFIFLFHCLLNPHVKTSFLKRTKKYSVSTQSHNQSHTNSKSLTDTVRISNGHNVLKNSHTLRQ